MTWLWSNSALSCPCTGVPMASRTRADILVEAWHYAGAIAKDLGKKGTPDPWTRSRLLRLQHIISGLERPGGPIVLRTSMWIRRCGRGGSPPARAAAS